MSQQGYRQQAVRAATGTTGSYEGDWHALFDLDSIPDGEYDGRLLEWLNLVMSAAYISLPEAMQVFAEQNGACNWSSMGLFTGAGVISTLLTEDGFDLLQESGDLILLE